MARIMSHNAHWLQFHYTLMHCRSPILNTLPGVVANCDDVLEWVHWVNASIGIAMWWWRCENIALNSIFTQKAILSVLIICIILCHLIYVAIGNQSCLPDISCHTTRENLCNYVHAADNVSHTENLESHSCRWISYLYIYRDRIKT